VEVLPPEEDVDEGDEGEDEGDNSEVQTETYIVCISEIRWIFLILKRGRETNRVFLRILISSPEPRNQKIRERRSRRERMSQMWMWILNSTT